MADINVNDLIFESQKLQSVNLVGMIETLLRLIERYYKINDEASADDVRMLNLTLESIKIEAGIDDVWRRG